MSQQKELKLAQLIVQLDLLRDELYEELLNRLGNIAHALLRAVQNKSL
jgi:hypothetical protein